MAIITAGKLTPDMIGKQKIGIEYQDAHIEGLLTGFEINTRIDDYNSRQSAGPLVTRYVVSIKLVVGKIEIYDVTRDHEVGLFDG